MTFKQLPIAVWFLQGVDLQCHPWVHHLLVVVVEDIFKGQLEAMKQQR